MKIAPGSNHRSAMRKAKKIDCQLVRVRDCQVFPERTVDLSEDGMLVRSDADMAVGDRLIVSFQATDLGIWFNTEATVTRLVRGRRAEDRGQAFGLRFHGLDRVRRLLIRGALRKVPPPFPSPRPPPFMPMIGAGNPGWFG